MLSLLPKQPYEIDLDMKKLLALVLVLPMLVHAQVDRRAKSAGDLIDDLQEIDNALCGSIAKEAVVVAKGAANGLSYEAAINQRDVTFGVMPQGRRVFQAAYHGMAGMPDVEVRMQAYKMCSGEAAKENDSLRRSTPTR